jgi:hypothetical protein
LCCFQIVIGGVVLLLVRVRRMIDCRELLSDVGAPKVSGYRWTVIACKRGSSSLHGKSWLYLYVQMEALIDRTSGREGGLRQLPPCLRFSGRGLGWMGRFSGTLLPNGKSGEAFPHNQEGKQTPLVQRIHPEYSLEWGQCDVTHILFEDAVHLRTLVRCLLEGRYRMTGKFRVRTRPGDAGGGTLLGLVLDTLST